MSPASNRPAGAGRRAGDSEVAESMRQAFERAVHHAQLALSAAVASARALLDAASIGISGDPARDHPSLAEFAWTLDQIAAALSGEAPSLRSTALSAMLETIDAEILRWEIRSRSDKDARAVLRAFLGLREILWEMGIRRSAEGPEQEFATSDLHRRGEHANANHPDPSPSPASAPGSARVQRIKIQG